MNFGNANISEERKQLFRYLYENFGEYYTDFDENGFPHKRYYIDHNVPINNDIMKTMVNMAETDWFDTESNKILMQKIYDFNTELQGTEDFWLPVNDTVLTKSNKLYYLGDYLEMNWHNTIRLKETKQLLENSIVKDSKSDKLYERFLFKISGEKEEFIKSLYNLFAKTFIPNIFGYTIVDHIDGNTLNNNPENLHWVNAQLNAKNTKNYRLDKEKYGPITVHF